MKKVFSLQYKNESKEELLPDFSPDFPYIASYAQLDKYIGRQVPWHWHKEVELFYIENGVLEYFTPQGKTVFPAGSGGIINSNVLHMTKPQDGAQNTTQLEHIFDPVFISGHHGSRIEQKYITPLVTAPQLEVIPLYPDDPEQADILQLLIQSFELAETDDTYEISLRATLSEIWCRLLTISKPAWNTQGTYNKINDKIKLMLIFIHEHFTEKITIADIAASAYISERECFRAFHDILRITPVEYLTNYRIQKACRMLAESDESITRIGTYCGLGSSSYFGKTFKSQLGCTPMEYRASRQLAES